MLCLTIVTLAVSIARPGENPAELAAWVDARLDAVWKAKNLTPRPVVPDDVFLRRIYLELTGTIPSVAEARDFLETQSSGKRERLIQGLLDDKRFAEHQSRLWARTMAPAGNTRGALEGWLRTEFKRNAPFNETARALLTATGDPSTPSPASFYSAVGNTPDRLAEAVARSLMGVRLGCAQCHNHPLASWKKEHFWGLAAFFAGTGAAGGRVSDSLATKITPTDSNQEYEAKFLEGPAPTFPAGKSPRAVLADWVVTPENPYFAANVVNRVWQDLCGGGLVSTIDDLDTLETDERKLILDELAAKFAASGYNLRWLIEGICLSKAYQRASSPSVEPGSAMRPVRTLSPDQVFASLDQALSLRKGRALSPRYTQEGQTLMQQLETARGSTPTDYKAGIPQALLLMNGSLVTQATTLEDSLTLRAVVDAPFLKDEEKLDTLYLAAYSRMPRADERERLIKIVKAKPDAESQRQAYANIFWAMLNSPEFVLCP